MQCQLSSQESCEVLRFKVAYCSVFTDKETGEPKGSAKIEPGTLQV